MIAEKEIKAAGVPRMHRPIRCPQKTGINMNMHDKRTGAVLTLVLGCACIAVVAGAVAKFGVIDLYNRLGDAQSAYAQIHQTNVAAQERLSHFEEVLQEYRAYSMDWMASGEDSQLNVSVQRTEVLDLFEQRMLPYGALSEIRVQGDLMDVELSNTNLDRIADLLLSVEKAENVASVELELAETGKDMPADVVNCTLHIVLQGEVAE